MPNKYSTVLAALVPVLLLCGPLHATEAKVAGSQVVSAPVAATVAAPLPHPAPMVRPVPPVGRSALPDHADARPVGAAAGDERASTTGVATSNITDLRKALLAAAMGLRDTRYVRGGRDPSTGFDCSGFVRYVFAHAIGLQLPNNSAAQFLAGIRVERADIKPGDLVFFHTRGRHRISHVGIYISDGRFIHSPTIGKSVEISSLDDGYWAKRFAGAKRPEALALADSKG